MSSPRSHRLGPGRILLALTAARRNVIRAFTVGNSFLSRRYISGGSPKPLSHSQVTTPLESPAPDNSLVSFFLLRHGETNFNAARRIQGTLDTSVLTDQGIAQAHEAGKLLASAPDLEFGPTVVVSPMRRAQQTLDCVREEFQTLGVDFEHVEVVPNVREIELFEWQGELVDDIKDNWPREFAAWKSDPSNFNLRGRYPARDLWKRASEAWEEIMALRSIQEQRKTLIVAHNAINQALLWTAFGCDTSYFRKLPWPNCAVMELQWRLGQKRAERYRWVIPEASLFVEAEDAVRLMKESTDDNQYTV